MPTYEYHCSKCSSNYELRESFEAPTTHTCEECGKGVAKRVLSAPRIVFKGSGWYVTDSRKSQAVTTDGSSTETAPGETGGDGGDSEKPGAKSNEKPAARSAEKPAKKKPGSKGSASKSGDTAAAAAS